MRFRTLLITFCLVLGACSSNSNEGSSAEVLDDQSQFLIDNAARDTVTVTASGLQYEVLRAADGSKPNREDIVTVHYAGTLVDGTEFDSSYTRGEPETFALAATILGFAEGVQLMSAGSSYRFVMPPELAYGDSGAGTLIEPGAVLIFVVELLEVNSAG